MSTSSFMSYAVVIPTNRAFCHIEPLLTSLVRQVFLPSQVIILYDQYAIGEELAEYENAVRAVFTVLDDDKRPEITIIHPLYDVDFKIGKGASYLRNYGRQQVTCLDMMFVDDDNSFDEYFAEKIFEYKKDKKLLPDGVASDCRLVVPIQYDDTSTYIRQAVADGFSFALCRPRWVTDRLLEFSDRYYPLSLSSSNCLVGATSLFERFPFDEEISFVYEDLIMTGWMEKSGVSIVCDTRSSLIHAHGDRGVLATLYIHTPLRAYYKSKHRIILIHTIGSTNDKILFYTIGLVGQIGWLWLHILRYAPVRQWWSLSWALVQGTIDGIREVIKS